MERYETSLKSLRPWFDRKRLDEIRAEEIERFKQARLQRGCSPSTVNRDLACLRRILSFALQLETLKRRLMQAKGDYIFPVRLGRGFDWSRPMWELHPAHYQALEDSEIEPPFQIYDLRHTYGTRAIESGTDPLTLMRLMGHQDLKTTMRYVHLSKTHLAEAQVRIERYRARREREEKEEGERRSRAIR